MTRLFFKTINFFLSRRKRPIKNSGFKKILVVSNTALGDTILSTPLMKSIKLTFPNSQVYLLTSKIHADLLKKYDYVDKFLVYDKRFVGLMMLIRRIKKEHIGAIFFSHSNGPQDYFIASLSGSEKIFKALSYPMKITEEFEKIISGHSNLIKQHTIESRLDMLRGMNSTVLEKDLNLDGVYPKRKFNGSKIILLQLAAADIYKVWPVEKFVKLAKRINLSSKNKYKFLLIGQRSEEYLAKKFINLSKSDVNVESYCGKTNLYELGKLISHSSFLITNDTGTLHLSIAIGTPTVSIFSQTDPEIYGPYQNLEIHKVVYKPDISEARIPKKLKTQVPISSIPVSEVYAAFLSLEGVKCQ